MTSFFSGEKIATMYVLKLGYSILPGAIPSAAGNPSLLLLNPNVAMHESPSDQVGADVWSPANSLDHRPSTRISRFPQKGSILRRH